MGGECRSDGTLTAGEFAVAARALCQRWEEQCSNLPRWTWRIASSSTTSPCEAEEGYLSLEDFCSSHEGEEEEKDGVDEEDDGGQEEEEEEDDAASLIIMEGNQHRRSYEFHIIYSFSYRVPVLYFRGYRCDGQPLELKQIEKDLPLYSSLLLRESKWTYITLEEHPFLHRPWYMLHPCGTSEWMKLLLSSCEGRDQDATESRLVNMKQYLPSWLSVVGQAVDLKVPLKLGTVSTLFNSPQCIP